MAAWRYGFNLLVLKTSLTRSLRSLVKDIINTRRMKFVSLHSHVLSSISILVTRILLYLSFYETDDGISMPKHVFKNICPFFSIFIIIVTYDLMNTENLNMMKIGSNVCLQYLLFLYSRRLMRNSMTETSLKKEKEKWRKRKNVHKG